MMPERKVDPETGEILEEEIIITRAIPTGTALIKVAPGMDMVIRSLENEAIKLTMYANKMVVANLEDEKRATNDLVMCRDMIKQVDGEQKKWLEPVREAESKIKAAFGLILSPLKSANEVMTQKITEYRREEKRKADEIAEIARMKAEVARREAEAAAIKAKAEGREPPPPPPPVVEVIAPEQVKTHQGDLGKTTMTTVWKWEVIDFSLLPDRFKMENATLIGKIVRAGERSIPGVRIYSEPQLRISPK